MSRPRLLAAALVAAVLVAIPLFFPGQFAWGTCTEQDAAKGYCKRVGETALWNRLEGRQFCGWLSSRGTSCKVWAKHHRQAALQFGRKWPPPNEVELVARRLETHLRARGSPMAPYAVTLARIARDADFNPFAIAGIAGKESSFGLYRCGGEFNAWGITACARAWWPTTGCVNGGPGFDARRLDVSWREAFRAVPDFIRCRWPNARTIYDLAGYCAVCPTWYDDIAGLMRAFGSTPELHWGAAVAAVR
jgi:hypothetical protein